MTSEYSIVISPEAEADVDGIYAYIAFEVMAPETAVRYYMGLYDTIQHLAIVGGALPVSQQPFLRKRYGTDVRTVHYKKITIIYNLIGEVVYIRRIMASSLIR
jgi:plasmid stabilization system protein ParE